MSYPIFALAILAIASIIGINQYTYGLYNHCITIPFIKSIIDPSLYPHDFLIADKKYLYTYFNSSCAWLVTSLPVSLPVLYFTLYCASLYATLIAFFKISMTLFPKREVAYFSVIFLIFPFTTLGEMRTIERLFLERTLVLPMLLFAFYFFLQKKIIWSYVLSGIAFLFHPLSAVYALACLGLCSVVSLREIGWKTLAVSLGLLVILVSPVLILKVQNPAPSLGLFGADPRWLELLHLRSAHHLFPTEWSAFLLIQSAVFIVGFGLCLGHKPAAWHHKTVMLTSAAVLLMCAAGTLFAERWPMSIIIQFQLFRGFVFLIFFAIIYYANFFFEESKSKGNVLKKALIVAFFVPVYFTSNYSKYASFLFIALAIFPGYAIFVHFWKNFSRHYIPALVLAVFIIGTAGGLLRGGVTIQNKQDADWLKAQKWVKQYTPKDALLIVPPGMSGFRVESERTIYADWKDGTQMFFNPQFGYEWIRRMKMLGYHASRPLKESYGTLNESDFARIAGEMKPRHSRTYAVLPMEREKLSLPVVYINDAFSVYEIPLTGVTEFNLVKDGPHEPVARSPEPGD